MKIELDIPTARIADLMISAMEHNDMTAAWCGGVYLKSRSITLQEAGKMMRRRTQTFAKAALDTLTSPWYADPALYADGHFLIAVNEIDERTGKITVHEVRPREFEIGFKLMAEQHAQHFGDFMAEKDDAVTADVFLQCVALGDVIYG